jgi:hypothetical protein
MAKVKVPKKVAGVKIPKKVRKKANKALKLADSVVSREMAVAALCASGVGRAAQQATGRPLRELDIETIVEEAREAALDGLRRFLEGFEEGLRKAADAVGEAADEVADDVRDDEPSSRTDASEPAG